MQVGFPHFVSILWYICVKTYNPLICDNILSSKYNQDVMLEQDYVIFSIN